MNPTTTITRVLATTALFLLASASHAHHVWLEQDAQGAKLYFGEFGGNLREASPGLLDRFVKPVAHRITPTGAQPLDIRKTADGFALAGRAGPGESLVAEETAYPPSERREGDKTVRSLYAPAARLVTTLAAQPPLLTLDLVPTGRQDAQGVQFQAFYKGLPLAKAKVTVVTPSGWVREETTDAQGHIAVQLPWRGTYVLEMNHRDTGPGQRANGDTWDRASYVTSLTVMQPDGLQSLPAPPPAAPNKAN
ncbi:MAG TPA: DUF4198 domain-containing protein [Ramlibacter sp.]|jgi:uncharacterized GH25 family protein